MGENEGTGVIEPGVRGGNEGGGGVEVGGGGNEGSEGSITPKSWSIA